VATQFWETIPFNGDATVEWAGKFSAATLAGVRSVLVPRLSDQIDVSLTTVAAAQVIGQHFNQGQLVKLTGTVLTQVPAPATDITISLALAVWGADPLIAPNALDVPGSAFTIPSPPVSVESFDESGYFTIPVGGFYLAVVTPVANVAGDFTCYVKAFAT